MKTDTQSKSEVRNLILMLGSSVAVAFAVVVILVYYLGQSGTYRLDQVLVSPQAMEQVAFTDFNPKTGKGTRFVFNKIEFVMAGKSGTAWGRYSVSPASYAAFYRKVRGLRSIPKIPDTVVEGFALITPSTLTIFVQPKGQKGSQKIFQEVEFLDGSDVFRIRLRQEPNIATSAEEWVYFSMPGIYREVIELFAPEKASLSLLTNFINIKLIFCS